MFNFNFNNKLLPITIYLILLIKFLNINVINAGITDESSMYTDVISANITDSLIRICNVPLKVYSFKYDSVTDRRQLGILGSDAQRWFPDSVEVVPSHSVVNKSKNSSTGSGPSVTVLKNFPVVNKQVIYMHGLAALQELSRQFDNLRQSISNLQNSGDDHQLVFAEIERRLAKEADEQLVEQKKLVDAETELATKDLELERVRADEVLYCIVLYCTVLYFMYLYYIPM